MTRSHSHFSRASETARVGNIFIYRYSTVCLGHGRSFRMLCDPVALLALNSRKIQIQKSLREQVRVGPLATSCALSQMNHRSVECRAHMLCTVHRAAQCPNLYKPISKEQFVQIVVDALEKREARMPPQVNNIGAENAPLRSSSRPTSGLPPPEMMQRLPTPELMQRLRNPNTSDHDRRLLLQIDKKTRPRPAAGVDHSAVISCPSHERTPEELGTAAAHIFDQISRAGYRGSGVVTVREAISYFRFGHGSAAGEPRPLSPVSLLTSSDASLSDRRAALAYDDPPAGGAILGRPSTRKHVLEPLTSASSISASSWIEVAPVSRLHSAEVSTWSDDDLRRSSLTGIRHTASAPNGIALTETRHTASAPDAMALKRHRRSGTQPPKAVLRMLGARFGKMRRRVGAAMEALHDGRGGCNLDALIDTLSELGAEALPPLILSTDEVRALAELYVVSRDPIPEGEMPATVGLRDFLRDLWSGTLTHAAKVPLRSLFIAESRNLKSAGSDALNEQSDSQVQRSDSPTAESQGTQDSRQQAGATDEADGRPKSKQGKWGMLLRRPTKPNIMLREVDWWRTAGSNGSNSSDAQRAATTLVEEIKEVADEKGYVTLPKFRSVMWTLGVIKSSIEDADGVFGSIDLNGNGKVTFEELKKAIESVINEDTEAKIERLVRADQEMEAAAVQRLRDRLASQAARVLDLFRQWDVDGDGTVTREEFRKAMLGPELGFSDASPENINGLFNAFDKDGEGQISFRELHRMLRTAKKAEKKIKVVAPTEPPCDMAALRIQMRKDLEEMANQNEKNERELAAVMNARIPSRERVSSQ